VVAAKVILPVPVNNTKSSAVILPAVETTLIVPAAFTINFASLVMTVELSNEILLAALFNSTSWPVGIVIVVLKAQSPADFSNVNKPLAEIFVRLLLSGFSSFTHKLPAWIALAPQLTSSGAIKVALFEPISNVGTVILPLLLPDAISK